ncbi:MAG TPA: ABC transporter ATP-binding protein [Chloroflexota bacterium]|nr:ABC transporter ATP-binding protein [Chloroflexota bacterium]
MNATPLLEVRHLTRYFPAGGAVWLPGRAPRQVKAVDDVSFTLAEGETLGLVGESGCGKSTLGRAILRLIEPTSGEVLFRGQDIVGLRGPALRELRRQMQMVFQDPYSALNPRMRVGAVIREPLDIYRIGTPAERRRRVEELLERVGLDASYATRYPHELSGGQRQRVGIAAALALEPRVIVADEPVSALDVSVQAQILNLLHRLRQELGLSLIFIAHNLDVVAHVSDRVAVMYLGKIVETAPAATLFAAPQHPYTRALLSAIPVPDPARTQRPRPPAGEIPSPLNPPSGCHFHPRCPEALPICARVAPSLQEYMPSCTVACHVAARRLGLPSLESPAYL